MPETNILNRKDTNIGVTGVNQSCELEKEEETLNEPEEEERISFCTALCLPKVLLFGFGYFCCKFAKYSLVLWFPLFLGSSMSKSDQEIANILSIYELGSALGSIFLGFLSDKFYFRRSPIVFISTLLSTLIAFHITFRY